MAFKKVEVAGIGTVKLYKRRGSRSVVLSVLHDGSVRVTLPSWLPYSSGVTYAKSKLAWIETQRNKRSERVLSENQAIGKAHRLHFEVLTDGSTIRTRVKENLLVVSHPASLLSSSSKVQSAAQTAIKRVLKQEAEALLPQRLDQLSEANGLPYSSLHIRFLKSRWGSCNQRKEIVLNAYLMQLPWSLIDYVLLHELTHTLVMAHGPKFWAALEVRLPNAKQLRREIKQHQPIIRVDENISAM